MSSRNCLDSISSFRRGRMILTLGVIASMLMLTNTGEADQKESIKLVASDGSYADYFGSSVAISGDYAIVGAPNDDVLFSNTGSAYIFERVDGVWTQKAKLIAPDRAPNDVFGTAVSISGDYAIVGAPLDDHTGSNYGSAYIYQRVGGNWGESPVAKLVALNRNEENEIISDGGPNDYFGNSVAISGDYAIVGAPNHDHETMGADSGAAYIFQRVGENWNLVTRLLAPYDLGSAGDLFGLSVAITGDNAIVGAPRFDFEDVADRGAVYVFNRSEEGWNNIAGYLLNTGGTAGEEFGGSVAIDGSFGLAGAPKYEADGGLTNAGSARLVEDVWDNGIWATQAQHLLVPSERAASDQFGFSVSISGDQAIVGSLKYSNGTGTVYVFKKSPTEDNWPQWKKLISSDNTWGFGSAVSVSGQYVIVGAKHSEAAYIYDLLSPPSSSVPAVPLLLLEE